MTNLLSVLPDFDIQPYAHILPSLEKALISTADLLTLDALDVAKRAQVPPGDGRRLAIAVAVAKVSEAMARVWKGQSMELPWARTRPSARSTMHLTRLCVVVSLWAS